MNPRHLVALAALSATTWGACEHTNTAHAQPPCGGNSTVHPAPIDCTNSKTIEGVPSTVRLVVDEFGYMMVTAIIDSDAADDQPFFLQVKAHEGISSDPDLVGAAVPFDGSVATFEGAMPRSLADNCTSQIDLKVVPGEPTLAHVSPAYRVAAPLVGIDLSFCQTPTTPPTSSPTSSTPTVPPTVAPSTTPGTGAPIPTVPGGTLPATGPRRLDPFLLGSFMLLVVGGGIVLAARRRSDA